MVKQGRTTSEGLELFLVQICPLRQSGEHDLTGEILTVWKMYRNNFK